MSIFGMGVPELLVILAIALLLFGPKNLPKLGKSLGATVKSIREGMDEGEGKAKDTDVTDVSDTVEEEPAEVEVVAKGKAAKSEEEQGN